MLYARCAGCGAIDGLTCSGQFMPHLPQYVSATPMGAACPMCGVLPPVFTCFHCWTQQFLYLPGAPTPAPQPGSNLQYAAVAQAPQGASQHTVLDAFSDVIGKAAGEFGKEAAHAMFGAQQ